MGLRGQGGGGKGYRWCCQAVENCMGLNVRGTVVFLERRVMAESYSERYQLCHSYTSWSSRVVQQSDLQCPPAMIDGCFTVSFDVVLMSRDRAADLAVNDRGDVGGPAVAFVWLKQSGLGVAVRLGSRLLYPMRQSKIDD